MLSVRIDWPADNSAPFAFVCLTETVETELAWEACNIMIKLGHSNAWCRGVLSGEEPALWGV